MGDIYELTEPVMVMDLGGQCQVSVTAESGGTILRFDGPNGEIKFRVNDDEWNRLKDAVWLAQRNMRCFNFGLQERDDEGKGDK